MDLSRNNSTANFGDQGAAPPSAPGGSGGPPPPMMAGGGNKFSGGLGKRRGAQVLNPFKNSLSTPALSSNLPPPSELFAPVAPINGAPTPSAEAEKPIDAGGPSAPSATTPEGGPVFFNPNAYASGPPTTRRNKY